MTTHTLLSPSASARWLKCADSARLNAESPRKAGVYAEEGTSAHALLELCMRLDCPPEDYIGDDIMRNGMPVTEEMALAVQFALDYIRGWEAKNKGGTVHLEQRVHWGAMHKLKADVSSGTADVIMVPKNPTRVWVMDYKHGAGIVVEPENNSQLMLYALGVAQEHKANEYVICVVQPRARHEDGPVREWVISHKDLVKWANRVVAPQAWRIMDGDKDREAGEWCRFCSAAGKCKTLRDFAMDKAAADFDMIEPHDTQNMSAEELAQVLKVVPIIESWVRSIYAQALDAMLNKQDAIPGWKLVLGKLPPRKWRDETRVLDTAKRMKLNPDAYAPRQLLSPTQMEKLVPFKGKKGKALFRAKLGAQVTRGSANPHIAPADDPRPVYAGAASDFEVVPDV